jgi:ABC-type polysaccharide/polyol phosphate transport system ATPase subunit
LFITIGESRIVAMNVALRVEGVAKQYRIYNRPSDRLKETLTRGRWKWHHEFWALRGLSFEIERGTTTGIIGPNGSGKSTLLQIIAGTLQPTSGTVWLDGRVAALLELGAGFNPEFTGLENVFMNAALLGFSRSQVQARLPDIERFAEIGDFIHQPVKTYSSGMYVRLAFAIAVNSDPEILIVDEALSVGDTIFQHRCVRRIREMQERGATILFVSHEPTLVRSLCSRAILLYRGESIADGPSVDVLNRYQRLIMARESEYEHEDATIERNGEPLTINSIIDREPSKPLTYQYRHGNKAAEVLEVQLLDDRGQEVDLIESGDLVQLRFRYIFHNDIERPVCGFMIRTRHGINVYGTNTEQRGARLEPASAGDIFDSTFAFNCLLGQEHYFISVAVHSPDGQAYDWLDGVVFFRVACATEMEGIANLNARVTTKKTLAPETVRV